MFGWNVSSFCFLFKTSGLLLMIQLDHDLRKIHDHSGTCREPFQQNHHGVDLSWTWLISQQSESRCIRQPEFEHEEFSVPWSMVYCRLRFAKDMQTTVYVNIYIYIYSFFLHMCILHMFSYPASLCQGLSCFPMPRHSLFLMPPIRSSAGATCRERGAGKLSLVTAGVRGTKWWPMPEFKSLKRIDRFPQMIIL